MGILRHFIAQMLPSLILASIVFVIVRMIMLVRRKRLNRVINWLYEIGLLVLVVFAAGLASQTIIPSFYVHQGNIGIMGQNFEDLAHMSNFVPFNKINEIKQAIGRDLWSYVIVEVGGNIAMFIPFGFVLPLLWQKFERFGMIAGTCFAISLVIELVQFVNPLRATDVDDLIMNTLGGTIGYLLYIATRKMTKHGTDKFKANHKKTCDMCRS